MKNDITLTSNILYLETTLGSIAEVPHMVAIYGQSGHGKTQALKYIDRYRKSLMVTCLGNQTPFSFVEGMLYGFKARRPRSYTQAVNLLIESLEKAKIDIILVDEADLLTEHCLLAIRKIHDISQLPIVMSGEPILYARMQQDVRIFHRTTHVEFSPLAIDDARRIASDAIDISISDEFLHRIHTESDGNFRYFSAILRHVEKTAQFNGFDSIDSNCWGRLALTPEVAAQPQFKPRVKNRRAA